MGPVSNNMSVSPSDWLDNYGDYLYSYALSRVGSKDQAQDIVQETLLAAYRTYENFSAKACNKSCLGVIGYSASKG